MEARYGLHTSVFRRTGERGSTPVIMLGILLLSVGIARATTFTPSDGGIGSGAAIPLQEVNPLLDRGDVEWQTFDDWPTSPAGFELSTYPFQSAVIIGDSLFCSPARSTSFLRVHRSTGQMSHFKVKTSTAPPVRGSSYDEANNILWAARYSGPVIALDLNAGTSREYNNYPVDAGLSSSHNFFGGFVDAQSKLFWMIPQHAASYVMVNTTDPTAEFQSLPLSSSSDLSCAIDKLAGAVLDPSTRIAYSAPISCNGFVGVHVDHRNLTVFKNWPTDNGYTFDRDRGDFHGTQFDGQKVWGVPLKQDHWVYLDPQTGVMGAIGDMPTGYTGGTNRFVGVSFDGRYIWAAPRDANMVMRVDTGSLTLKGFKRQASGWFGGSAVGFEQHALWMCPSDASAPGVVRIDFATSTRSRSLVPNPGIDEKTQGTKIPPIASSFTPTDGGLGSGARMPLNEVTPLLDRGDLEWETFNDWPTSPAGLQFGTHPFLGAMMIGDYLWCSPQDSTSFVRVHRSTGHMSHFKVKTSTFTAVRGSSFDEANNILWSTRSSGPVVALDLNTGTSQEYSNHPANAGLTSGFNFFGSFVDPRSKLFWMVPQQAASYVMVNTTEPTAEFQSLPLSSSSELVCAIDKLGGAVLDPSARVAYSAPIQCNGFVGVHVDHRNLTVFKNWPTGNGYAFDRSRHDFLGTQFDGQKVWGIPYKMDHWVYLDPQTGVMGNIGDMPAGYIGGVDRFHAASSFDGRYIWGAPYEANMMIRVDTVSLTLKGILMTGSGRFGGSAVDFEQHALWLCPYTSGSSVVRVQFATPTREVVTQSASLASQNKTVTRSFTDVKQTSTIATLSTTSTAGPSDSRTTSIINDGESQVVQLSHSQERMSKTIAQEIQSQQPSGGSSSESSDRELNLAQPRNSSSPPTDSLQDLGAATNFVEQLLDSRTAASVIVAVGQASTVIAGVTVSSPLVATRAVRIGSVASILNSCSADTPEDPAVDAADAQLSYFELPFQLGSAVTIDGSKAGVALLGTTVLLVVAPWTVLLLIHRLRMVPLDAAVAEKAQDTSGAENGDRDDHEDGGNASMQKVQKKVVSVFCGMTFGYFAPAMVKYPIYFMMDKGSSPSLLVIALFCFLTSLAITAVSIYAVTTLKKHSSIEVSMGELRKKEEEKKDDALSASVVSSPGTQAFPVSPGYLATTGFLYDGSRDVSQAHLRFYFVEEVTVSLLFGMLDGFAISTKFPQSACTGLVVAGLVVAVLHLAYVAGFRSYEDKVELLFSVLNAALLASLTAAVLATEVKYRSNEVPELELDIIGVLGIACFSTFFAQALIMAILVCYRNSKNETLARQEQVEAAKAAKAWDQDEKTTRRTGNTAAEAPTTSRTEDLGTALLSIIPERRPPSPSDHNQQQGHHMSASAGNPLLGNPLIR